MKFLKDVPLVNSPTGQPTLILIDESTGLEHRIAISDLLAQVAFTGDYDDLANKLTTTDVINLILGNPSGARAALGLGNSATLNVGTAAGTVAAGDHTHDASDITYNPDDPSDWSGSPGQAAEAIDELAERVKDIEDNPVSVDNAAVNSAISTNPGATRSVLGLGNSATRNVGTTAGTVAAGDDARLSNARTPTAHAASHHTGGSDALAPSDIGAADANHVHESEDITFTPDVPGDWDTPPSDVDEALNELADRVSAEESRTPTNAEVNTAISSNASASRSALGLGNAATRNVGTTAGTVAAGDDARLSNARTPTAHASSHHTGGSDALAPSDIGAADVNHVHDADEVTYAPTTGGNWDGAPAEVEAALDELAGRDRGSVKLSGNQTISGVKTFSSSPVVPTPTTSGQAVNKGYVDLMGTTALAGFRMERIADNTNPSDVIGPYPGSFSLDSPGWGSTSELRVSVIDLNSNPTASYFGSLVNGDMISIIGLSTVGFATVTAVDTSNAISDGYIIIDLTAPIGSVDNVGGIHGFLIYKRGAQGPAGASGQPFGLKYEIVNSTPSAGEVRISSGAITDIHEVTKDSVNAYGFIESWYTLSNGNNKGLIIVQSTSNPTDCLVTRFYGSAPLYAGGVFILSGHNDQLFNSGTLNYGDEVNITFIPGGPRSEAGNIYNYSILSGNPSAGNIRWDSTGEVFRIHDTDLDSNSIIDLMLASADLVGPTKAVLEIRDGPTLYNIPIGGIAYSGSVYTLTPSVPPSALPPSGIPRAMITIRPAGVVPVGATVPLGRWEATDAASLAADGVLNANLYPHYTITGRFRPATNGADFSAVTRTPLGEDVGGGLSIGGAYTRLDASESGTAGPLSVLATSVSSAAGNGVTWFRLELYMSSGVPPGIELAIRYGTSSGPVYAAQYNGQFNVPGVRRGIRFFFSSGNIAEGWFEIVGHPRQAP